VSITSDDGKSHLRADDEAGAMVGGFFCIPMRRRAPETTCDLGWVFVSPRLPAAARRALLDALMSATHTRLRHLGFEFVVTNMGTLAGARILSQWYGYHHEPIEGMSNRWVRRL